MSKSGIRRKQDEDATQLRRRSHLASHTYMEDPPGRANGGATEDARKDKVEGPPVSLPEKDKDERWIGGAGRPSRSAEPGQPPVQVHIKEESAPSLLITFHTCIWPEPTSIPFSPRKLSSLLLS